MNTWNRPFLGAPGHAYPQVAASFASWIAALLRLNPTAIHSRNPILWSCTGFLTARWLNFFLRQHRRRQPRRVIRGASVHQIATVRRKILQQSQSSILSKTEIFEDADYSGALPRSLRTLSGLIHCSRLPWACRGLRHVGAKALGCTACAAVSASSEARLGQAVVRVVTSEQTSPCGGARCWTRGRRPGNEPGHPGLRRGAPGTPTENAKPLFPRHHLAFSDLRVPEDRQAQAYGRRLLNSPFGEVLASSRPDLHFCLGLANQNWSGAWNGGDREVVMLQSYSSDNDRAHIEHLSVPPDPRYIRFDGRPPLLLYGTALLPNPFRTPATWRERVRAARSLLCLVRVAIWIQDIDLKTTGL